MWRKQREYSLDVLLDHPGLGFEMTETGIDRRAVELLLEPPQPLRPADPDRADDPISA